MPAAGKSVGSACNSVCPKLVGPSRAGKSRAMRTVLEQERDHLGDCDIFFLTSESNRALWTVSATPFDFTHPIDSLTLSPFLSPCTVCSRAGGSFSAA